MKGFFQRCYLTSFSLFKRTLTSARRPWSSSVKQSVPTKTQLSILSEKFHKPGENHLTDGYVVTPHTKNLLQTHLSCTGGKVITRFPPEPNGYLHIGHAMAMNFSFMYASIHGGVTLLRYDDTNPETMKDEYVRNIREMVEWMGFTPEKVTYSSDYFPDLYVFAQKLIRTGHAYVCFRNQLQKAVGASPWRDRPALESLQLFEDMKEGRFKPGEATLRMKVKLQDGKRDPVAYRIKDTPHPRSGDAWCIYPTYDFAHCLCDSIENITHSFCSKEFMIKRPSYYWLCNALNVYCPVQWEFSRLNVSHALVSKRRILKLLTDGVIKDWDDPRLYTLSGLRKRGVPPEAIRAFCDQYGVLQSDGEVDLSLIDHYIRRHLNQTAPRVMTVVDPIKLTVQNFPWPEGHVIEVPNNKNDASSGTRQVSLGPELYIERSDFREDCPEGYNRLTPDQPVGLKYTHCSLKLEEVVRHPDSGKAEELRVSWQDTTKPAGEVSQPKAYIHWVSNPLPCTMRFYQEVKSSDSSPGSLTEVHTALVEASLRDSSPGTTFQAERVGYFSVDPDSSPDKLIFNRTLSLRAKSDMKWRILPAELS